MMVVMLSADKAPATERFTFINFLTFVVENIHFRVWQELLDPFLVLGVDRALSIERQEYGLKKC